jgi:hypothetical protein
MSDFARIAKTVDESALKLYISRLGTAAADVVEANPFARAVIKFMEGQAEGRWNGLASELVTEKIPGPDPLPKGWPQDPTRFGVWVKRYGRVLESAAGIRITKEERTSQGQPYTLERIPSAESATEKGEPATSAAQLHGDAPASKDAGSPDVAGEHAQLHSYRAPGQRGCSSVADVAEIPILHKRLEDRCSPRGTGGRGLCAGCGNPLDPKLAKAGDTTHPNCGEDPAA